MKSIKGYLSIIIVVLSIGYVCYITGIRPVMIGNDSGFDTSYGGGGSSYSSSDYSSHDSYDSDGETGDVSPVGVAVIVGIFALIMFFSITSTISKNKHSNKSSSSYKELSEEEIRKIIPDFNLQQFLNDRLQDFIDIQVAWQNFDDKVLMEKLSGTLYNQYKMQLDTLKIRHQQNIMSDFKKNDMIVLSAKEENNKYIVEVGLVIAFKDYIVENGEVVRGDKDATIVQKYKLKFIKSIEEQYEFCPSCGAKLNDNNRQVCGYCHSTIYRVSTKWVMSEKTSLEQDTLY